MPLFRKLITGSVTNLIDHVLSVGILLATTPLMIRELGNQSYGVWLLALAIISYFRIFEVGFSFAGTRFLGHSVGAEDREGYDLLLRDLNRLFLGSGIAATFLTLIATVLLPLFLEDQSMLTHGRMLIVGFGLLTAVRFSLRIFEVTLKAQVRYDLLGLASIARTAVRGVGVLIVLLSSPQLIHLFFVHIVSEGVYQLILISFVLRMKFGFRSSGGFESKKSRLGELLRFSGFSCLTFAGRTLRNGIDPLVISSTSGVSAIPVYNIGVRFLQLFADLMNTLFGGTIFSAFSQIQGQNDHEKLCARFLRSCHFSSAGATLIGSGLLMLGPDFIIWWVGTDFHASGTILLILTPPTVLWLMQFPVSALFLSAAKHHQLAYLTLIAGLFNLSISIILARKIGIYGVVWGTAIELTLVYGLIIPILVFRAFSIKPMRYLGALVIGSAEVLIVAAIFYLGVRSWIQPKIENLVGVGVGFLVLQILVGWFRVLGPEEKRKLKEMAKWR